MDQKTALYQTHVDLGAKMVPFAGFLMPVQYSGVIDEHNAVRERVGMFDVSHMGQFLVEGKDAKSFLQYVTSNDVDVLKSGKAQYTCFPNENGGIVDDLIIYEMEFDKFLVVVNAANIQKDWDHIQRYVGDKDINLTNISDVMSLMAVQGPDAIKTLQKLTEVDLSTIPFYHFEEGEIGGIKDVIISNTGYTGSGGFELYVNSEHAVALWNKIMEAGAEFNILPCGLAARDTLRLEKGYCLYGNDIDDTTSPLEAGLGWITKLKTDFVGKEPIAKQKEDGLTRKLVAFKMKEKAIPRTGYEIVDQDGINIGFVTSGTMSPTLSIGIGLAYVNKPFDKVSTEIYVAIRKKNVLAEVCKLPFV